MSKDPDVMVSVRPTNSIPTQMGSISEQQSELEWEADDIPEPPNGGWGWVIVLASFMCNCVVDGIAYTFGIFLTDFVNYFGTTRAEAAWVGSLLSGTYMSVGPLVSALTNSFGCRPVTIAGSILSCIAFMLSIWAPSVKVLMFTYGIMGGFGFGLIYLPAIVSVSYYFSTKRAFATGIAVCGSGMGAFTFAPLCQLLLDTYNWKGAMMILAGISLNCVVFGALMKPLGDASSKMKEWPENTEPGVQSSFDITGVGRSSFHVLTPLKESPTGSTEDKVEFKNLPSLEETLLPNHFQISDASVDSRQMNGIEVEGIRKHSMIHPRPPRRKSNIMSSFSATRKFSMVEYPTQVINTSIPTLSQSTAIMNREAWQGIRRVSLVDRKDLYRPLYRKDIFYSGSITQLEEYHKSNNDVKAYVASVTSIPTLPPPSIQGTVTAEPSTCVPRNMKDTLMQMLDFNLLYDYSFLLLCLVNILGMMGYYIPFVYITENAVHNGIPRSSAVYLISIIGVTNIVGRLLFGYIADRPGVNVLMVNNFCLIMSGAATLSIPFCPNYAWSLVACSCFGLFISAYISLTSIILVELLGLEKLTNSFGLLCLFRGAASIAGPPLAGTILDNTSSYKLTFSAAAIMLFASGIITFLVPVVSRWSPSKKSKPKQDVEKPLMEPSPNSSGETITTEPILAKV